MPIYTKLTNTPFQKGPNMEFWAIRIDEPQELAPPIKHVYVIKYKLKKVERLVCLRWSHLANIYEIQMIGSLYQITQCIYDL